MMNSRDGQDFLIAKQIILSKVRYSFRDLMHFNRKIVIDLNVAHPFLQPLPDGNLLLVGARCRRFSNGGAEHNAQVFSTTGELIREITFGDGIEDVQMTEGGNIWVSYFDEGIFGNSGCDDPIGYSSLVCFDPNSRKLMEFIPPSGFDAMADCYALNVFDKDVWAYYYSDFPLIHINSDGKIQGWNTPMEGARAFAMDDTRVLFYGDYERPEGDCDFSKLDGTDFKELSEYRLILPSSERFSNAVAIGYDFQVFLTTYPPHN